MIKKELEIIKETEVRCKELLAEAEQERQRIFRNAQEEVRLQHEELTRAAHEEGERHMEEAAAREAEERMERLKQWEEQVGEVRAQGFLRMGNAVLTIFEGMWTSGDRADDQLQPDGA